MERIIFAYHILTGQKSFLVYYRGRGRLGSIQMTFKVACMYAKMFDGKIYFSPCD